MGFVGSALRVVFYRIFPVLVLVLAIIVGYFAQQEDPLAFFFAALFPVLSGHLPPAIFGHGKLKGTPKVPDDMKPEPRPANEMFLTLPGNFTMPQNGLGMCCRVSAYDDVLVRRTVLWYLLQGGRLIDGAQLYLNHRAIGQGIRDAIERGVPREEIFVTTKIPPSRFGYNTTIATIPTYLEELGLEYLDLVLMHAPKALPIVQTNECKKYRISNKECRETTWKALSELREQGIMRNIGVSNFAIGQMEEIEELDGVAPIAVQQMNYNPWIPDHWAEVFEYCQKKGIAVTAYGSLGGTMQHSEAATADTLNHLASKYNRSVVQILLRWALQSNAAVIPGTGNPKHMKENLATYSFELTEEDMVAIEKLRSDEQAKKFFFMPLQLD
jgi:diketogulonate reductase-like aldo/keto reductase